jgi:hypothetical protein
MGMTSLKKNCFEKVVSQLYRRGDANARGDCAVFTGNEGGNSLPTEKYLQKGL